VMVAIMPAACRRAPLGDSTAERIAEARKFLKTMDLRALADGMADSHVADWPSEKKESFRAFFQREIRWEIMEEMITAALTKNFTAAEIRNLAEFQNSDMGKSLLKKLPAYQDEVIPVLQAEINRVLKAGDFARTRLHWEAAVRELAAGPADEAIETEFPFSNDGSAPVSILSITPSCGCTTAKLEKDVFNPGERGAIRVIFTIGSRVGPQEERIVVTTDEPGKPAIALQLRVAIPEAIKIAPRILFWKSGEKNVTKTVTMEIPTGQDIEITAVDSIPAEFSVKTILDRENQIFLAHVTPKTTGLPILRKFVIQVQAGATKIFRIPVYLKILAPALSSKSDKGISWNNVLWIDAQPLSDFAISHIPGAFPLSEEMWDRQIEAILAHWLPGQRIVVYCQPPCPGFQVYKRLLNYGLDHIFVLAPGD
jgi:rhodanese-related sulfurtransferase